MDMMMRKLNWRPSYPVHVSEQIGGNYYAVDTVAFIRDAGLDQQLAFITDRSHGCSSQAAGSLEIELHRRLLCEFTALSGRSCDLREAHCTEGTTISSELGSR
jgi:hypothetical protein